MKTIDTWRITHNGLMSRRLGYSVDKDKSTGLYFVQDNNRQIVQQDFVSIEAAKVACYTLANKKRTNNA